MTLAIVLDELLRDRTSLFVRIDSGDSLDKIARALIVITAASAAVFGASIGIYKGGIQVAFAAIKVPAVLLLTAAISAPAWSALRTAAGIQSSVKTDFVRILGGLAMVSLVLAAVAPFLLVGVVVGASYHTMAILLFVSAATAGAVGVVVLFRSGGGGRLWVPLTMFVALFAIVGAQMSWTLRPYLVRPRSPEVPFVRSLEGGLLESATRSWQSMQGNYERDFAPLPGEHQGYEDDTWR